MQLKEDTANDGGQTNNSISGSAYTYNKACTQYSFVQNIN